MRISERTIAIVSRDSTGAGQAATAADSSGLAPIYGQALALRDAGVSNDAIASALGVTSEAVPALIEIATRKHVNHGLGPKRADQKGQET